MLIGDHPSPWPLPYMSFAPICQVTLIGDHPCDGYPCFREIFKQEERYQVERSQFDVLSELQSLHIELHSKSKYTVQPKCKCP